MKTPVAVQPTSVVDSDTYFVIIDELLNNLIKHVNAKIAQGWTPQGGVCSWNNTDTRTYFLQAMVKK